MTSSLGSSAEVATRSVGFARPRTDCRALVFALVIAALPVAHAGDQVFELTTASRRLVRAKKLQSGQTISIARDQSTELSSALYADVTPHLKKGLEERGYAVGGLDRADALLVFEVATEPLTACAMKGPGGSGYVRFAYRNPHARDDERARHELTIEIASIDPETTCPLVDEMRRIGIGKCPETCLFEGYVHYASVSVYAARPYRTKGKSVLLWDGIALLTDLESRDPADGDHAAQLAVALVREAFDNFPGNVENRTVKRSLPLR